MKAFCFKKTFRILVLLQFLFLMSGCYFRATISPAEEPAPATNGEKSSVLEAVSGAHGYTTTPGSYRIHHSVGFKVPKQKYTTPQGYQVFNHAQGIISSEEIQ